MTKDGRPSRIADIRYFAGDARSYLQGQEEAVAFGRRMAWFLNGEDFCLGAYPALYLYFTPSLSVGAVVVTAEGGEWWQRYTHVGVPSEFPDVPDATEIVMRGTVDALLTIRPDQTSTIRMAEHLVRTQGATLRFLLKQRESRLRTVQVSFSISRFPLPSLLHVSIFDRIKGSYLEAPGIPLMFYQEAFDLAGIRVSELDLATFVNAPTPVMSRLVKRQR